MTRPVPAGRDDRERLRKDFQAAFPAGIAVGRELLMTKDRIRVLNDLEDFFAGFHLTGDALSEPEPCGYCGSIDGLTPPNDWHNDPLTGDTLRAAIESVSELVNPRISEVDWYAVAAHWTIGLVRDHAEAFGLVERVHLTGDERLREAAREALVVFADGDGHDVEYVDHQWRCVEDCRAHRVIDALRAALTETER